MADQESVELDIKYIAVPKETPSFEEDGLRLFKPASYVIVDMNQRIYETLDEKYDMKKITHEIAAAIDKAAKCKSRNLEVIFVTPGSRMLTTRSNKLVIENIDWDYQRDVAAVIKRELLAVGGYNVKCPETIDQYPRVALCSHTNMYISW
jgi:hypothetical protein